MTTPQPPAASAPAFDLDRFRDVFMGLIRMHRYEAAEYFLREELALHPASPRLQYEAGFHYSKESDFIISRRAGMPADSFDEKLRDVREKAFTHFALASALDPARYLYAFRAGVAGRRLAHADAGVYLRRAIEIEPGNAHPWMELGILNRERGQRPTAVICFENAVRLDPADDVAQRGLSRLIGTTRAQGPVDNAPLSGIPVLPRP